MLVDPLGRAFTGERIDTPGAWQMPQGGLDEGEIPERAAVRELREETGIVSVELLAVSGEWRSYDLPPQIASGIWGGRWRGQAQIWTLFAFVGDDAEIDIETKHPEFRRWKWTPPDRLLDEIVDFKRGVYEAVLEEFGPAAQRSLDARRRRAPPQA